MKISKNKKMRFFLMSQGSLDPKLRFLGRRVCHVARGQTDRHTDTKVNTEDILSGFQEFFLQPIIKDRSKNDPLNCENPFFKHKLFGPRGERAWISHPVKITTCR